MYIHCSQDLIVYKKMDKKVVRIAKLAELGLGRLAC